MIQKDLFTEAEITTSSPAIAKPFVSRSTFYQGDCLVEMDKIADKSIDMILCDLPYGTTNRNKWDIVIPFDLLWKQYDRIAKDNAAILLFSDEPFTSELILSNRTLFKQRITWDKDRASGFPNANKMLMKQTEDICLFYKNRPTYIPQMVEAKTDRIRPINKGSSGTNNYGKFKETKSADGYNPNLRFPTNLIKFTSWAGECNPLNRLHPTQKPIELIDWLIKTYSLEGNTVLDNCMGSGTTGVVCVNTNRDFIGIELDESYFAEAEERIWEAIRRKERNCR